jgi:hypothetical protein
MMLCSLLSGCIQVYTSWQGREKLRKSGLLVQEGEYRAALSQYWEVYGECHDDLGDQALFKIGLLYAHPNNPDADYGEAARHLERIAGEFPQSPFRNEAAACVHLLRSIEELKEHLHSLEASYVQDRETLSQLEREVGEKKKKIAWYHRLAGSRKAAIQYLKSQISELQGRLDELEAQLSDLKKIDLMMEERRRKDLP